MNRQVSATTVLAALLLMVGAVLFVTQWPIFEAQAHALASPFYLVAEIGLYLVLLVILDRGITSAGYTWGAFGALGIRMALGFAAAGLSHLRAGGPFDAHLYPALFSPAQVAIAVVTASVVLVLLRDLLPQRRQRVPASSPKSARTRPQSGQLEQVPRLAFGAGPEAGDGEQQPAGVVVLDESQQAAPPAPAAQPEPAAAVAGEVELPLSVLLREAPEQIKMADGHETTLVRIPMSLIGPKLAEGRVTIAAEWLAECAPEGAVDTSGLEGETEVVLPLDAVVAALPDGALDLGPPSPPSWQCSLDESEETLFSAA